MKKLILWMFVLSACSQQPQAPQAGPKTPESPKPLNAQCSELKPLVGKYPVLSREEFFSSLMTALETVSKVCPIEDGTEYLDSIFTIQCDEICSLKEK